MKEVRPVFTLEEYQQLYAKANQLSIPLKQLVHDRAVGANPADKPLSSAQMLANEISKTRDVLNRIIQREITADPRLYEDDMIRMEMAMTELEGIVTTFISEVLRRVH